MKWHFPIRFRYIDIIIQPFYNDNFVYVPFFLSGRKESNPDYKLLVESGKQKIKYFLMLILS